MSHIANKIDAKDKNLAQILTGERYKIDVFQREYRWQRKQIEALISDLSISFLNNYNPKHDIDDCVDYDCYYMGPIVLCKDGGSLSIVDGQQRLTSFTLILIFLHHAQEELDLEYKKDLMQFLYISKLAKRTLVLNVDSRNNVIEHLINNPAKTYTEIEDLEDEADDETYNKILDESIKNIIERYEDITKLFPNDIKNSKVLPLFIEWLLDKVVLVEVKAYSMENAYTIFETMNDRGLSLNPTEILKGFLLSKIEDEKKSEELNNFWKDRIAEIKSCIGSDSDLDFFRSWLRAKYAISIRATKQGAENEDFELIGTQFHSWIKNNPKKLFLKNRDSYYLFIRSDFDFFSSIYIDIHNYKYKYNHSFERLYLSNFYPIADSLTYPIFLSPISQLDEKEIINIKIDLVSKFIDVYTNIRAIGGRPLTQSSIRYSMYELVKSIRNADTSELKEQLYLELEKGNTNAENIFSTYHTMDNWGYYHYFYARILYFINNDYDDFSSLLRSRKQSSFVLQRIFNEEDFDFMDDVLIEKRLTSVANFCLIRRYHIDEFLGIRKPIRKINFLIKNNYIPEMPNAIFNDCMEFIDSRDYNLKKLTSEIWNFNFFKS